MHMDILPRTTHTIHTTPAHQHIPIPVIVSPTTLRLLRRVMGTQDIALAIPITTPQRTRIIIHRIPDSLNMLLRRAMGTTMDRDRDVVGITM